jgi:AAA15 family ATPase/GTPase
MFIDFRVRNFRSFWEEQHFSMVASRQEDLPENCIDTPHGLKLLRSAVL